MKVYLDLVILLNFAVNYWLLGATARLTGSAPGVWRLGAGAAVGAAYGGLCMLPGLGFLGGNLWRVVFLVLMVAAAFGVGRGQLRQGAVLLGLSFALGGLALCLQLQGFWALMLAAAGLYLLCRLFLRKAMGHAGQLVPVRIRLGSREASLTALRDSGNTLRDPFGGGSVLVAQLEAAKELLPCPVTREELRDPGTVLARLQALGLWCRLIPYKALGAGGVLLAVRCDEVKIGGRLAGPLVALAPDRLSEAGTYQALAGGGAYE